MNSAAIFNVRFRNFRSLPGLNCLNTAYILFLLLPAVTYSQDQIRTSDSFINKFRSINNGIAEDKSDFSLLIGSVGHTLSSPLHWHSEDFITLCGFAVMVSASFLLDDETRIIMLKNRAKIYDKLAPVGFSYGAPQYAAPGAVAFYLAGLIAENSWLRTTGLMMTESLITIGIIQIPARIIAGRARPLTGDKNTSFELFKGVGQFRSSFISGHSAIAFAFSTILADQINNTWASIGLYTLASLTPLSRLYDDKHWLSDTVIGSAMGVFIANSILNYHKSNSGNEEKASLVPILNGILFTYRF